MKKMKNILYTFIALFFSISLNAQFYWTSEHVEINEGMQEEYEKFEAFWGVAKEKAIADGLQAGWSIWKVDPSSNDDNPLGRLYYYKYISIQRANGCKC